MPPFIQIEYRRFSQIKQGGQKVDQKKLVSDNDP